MPVRAIPEFRLDRDAVRKDIVCLFFAVRGLLICRHLPEDNHH